MKKIAGMLIFSLFSSISMASDWPPIMPLDKVDFLVSTKEWVTTQTATLSVNINATLNNADLVKARADIMDKLAKIAPGSWHLTQFNRSQDSSGLEKLFVEAQIRVPQTSLTDIYKHAKDISQPGTTYTINGVDFKPNLEEIQQVREQLRERLYKQVNDELGRLNKIYPSQTYTVNHLYIFDGQDLQQQNTYRARAMNNNMVMAASAMAAPSLTVSNELIMSAIVELASNRQGSNTVANH